MDVYRICYYYYACSVRDAIVFSLFSVFSWTGESDSSKLCVDTYFFKNGGKKYTFAKISGYVWSGPQSFLLLVFSVTPFKIDQNKNQNRSIDKGQNLGNERWYIYKDLRQDSGQRIISNTRYPKKCFTQTYGDAMLVLAWMSSNMADGNQQKQLLPSFATKA